MRIQELEEMMLIDCLVRHKKLTVAGNDQSFYSHFGIVSDGNGGYDDSRSPIKYKSVRRGVDRLVEKGFFVEEADGKKNKNETFYQINPSLLSSGRNQEFLEWKRFLQELEEMGEHDTYLLVAKYMMNPERTEEYLDETEMEILDRTVKENENILKADRDVIHQINEAFEKNLGLQIEYEDKNQNAKLYSVVPISYVISRDGTRSYLYAERKNKLHPPLKLEKIKVKGTFPASVNREEYIQKIQKAWDIDTQASVHVKIYYDIEAARKDYFDQRNQVKRVLAQRLGKPSDGIGGGLVFEGDIFGINDLEVWIRTYSEYCYVLEPVSLREKLIAALKIKKERYEGS